eukprot:gene2208-2351_t
MSSAIPPNGGSIGPARPKLNEIKMYENSKERDQLERLADLYEIIKTTELLETAYARDAISPQEYSENCNRLISQFKTTEKGLVLSKAIENADTFFKEYQVDCPRAYERLILSGVAATVIHPAADNRLDSVIVAETVQAFITSMDALKLGQRAVDEIQPLIADLMGSLAKVRSLPQDFEGLVKIKLWLQKLNEMRAADEIEEDEIRQLLFDIESSYSAFHKHLSNPHK